MVVDEAEFDQVFLEVLQRLHSRVVVLVGSSHLADDVVQDVYVRLRVRDSRRRRFVEHPNPYGYALATAKNLARWHWRSTRRETPLDLATVPAGDGGLACLESWETVTGVLQALTSKEVAVVLLVDFDGCSIDEAAKLLGVHKGTAQRNRSRALTKLRGLFTTFASGAHGNVR